MLSHFGDPATVDLSIDSRAITFENPTGDRGRGGAVADGRKGAPSRTVGPGERVVLADVEGPGRVTHLWMTFQPAPPEQMRAVWMEAFYDELDEPSISVPCLDFFGVAHGRPVPFTSALTAMQEGRGFNSYVPMPFANRLRLELVNSADRPFEVYFQADFVLGVGKDPYLHVSWRRENPTTMGRDMVIADGIEGPGRFLGCNVGVRVLDEGIWYGEGEVKIYRDGDEDHPTICGTGLEDYVGTAWGMGPHDALYAGAPLEVQSGDKLQPDFVSFYRWHLPDPIMFGESLRVTIQQIGYAVFLAGQEDSFQAFAASHPVAGEGWRRSPGIVARGIVERVDDYCATAYLYTARPQPVPRLEIAAATADIERTGYEEPAFLEQFLQPADSELFHVR